MESKVYDVTFESNAYRTKWREKQSERSKDPGDAVGNEDGGKTINLRLSVKKMVLTACFRRMLLICCGVVGKIGNWWSIQFYYFTV